MKISARTLEPALSELANDHRDKWLKTKILFKIKNNQTVVQFIELRDFNTSKLIGSLGNMPKKNNVRNP